MFRRPREAGSRTAGSARLRRLLASAAVMAAIAAGAPFLVDIATAQIPDAIAERQTDPDAQLLLQADQLVYDYDNNRVTALGNVEIYYDGYAVEAQRVVYDQAAGRVRAEGEVRIEEPDGNVLYADTADVTEDLRDGFVDALRVESVDDTRFAAVSAERLPGDVTVFRRGVYTACAPCQENPQKPPLWQVRAQRIIYDREERVVYYRDASLEFFGLPIAYLPYFAHPDPENERQSGFLPPDVEFSDDLGVGVTVPYYFALAPNYDLTVSPTVYSQQGLLGQAEFRHRLINGSYNIRAAGIFQADPGAFSGLPGDRRVRGSLQSEGKFHINSRWQWGWDVTAQSDRTFLRNYSLIGDDTDELKSDLYLTGQGMRNFFDARFIHFQSLTSDTRNAELPWVHPLVDYSYVADRPIFGGELSADLNFASLTRERADAFLYGEPGEEDALFGGVEGSVTRLSLDAQWRRRMVGPAGQIFTPFLSARSDVYALQPENGPFDASGGAPPLSYPDGFDPDHTTLVRGMPAVGMEYRWPLISAGAWGSQILEPMAQVIARPNEANIGEVPNEDAQSLVFDDTTLFDEDKFSGFDRVEGGVRANLGVNYTLATYSGLRANMMFGQSYHLAGRNSYDVPDLLSTGTNSGLETDTSDYVGRMLVEPTPNLRFATRFRLDEDTFEPKRLEVGAQGRHGRLSGSLTYASLEPQPFLEGVYEDIDSVSRDFEEQREAIGTAIGLQLDDFWKVDLGANYDIGDEEFRNARLGLTYEDECLLVSLAYVGDFMDNDLGEPDHRVLLQLQLRTLGGAQFSQELEEGLVGN